MTSMKLDEIEARVRAQIPPSFSHWDGFVAWVVKHDRQRKADALFLIEELRKTHGWVIPLPISTGGHDVSKGPCECGVWHS